MRLFFFLLIAGQLQAQTHSPANGHSHNDYQQVAPLSMAYKAQLGSIEADVFLKNGELFVAHFPFDIKPNRTLNLLYLQPLAVLFRQNKEKIYANYPLQLLIDLKTPALPTLDRLVSQLKNYPELLRNAVKIVISGNMPAPEQFKNYPDWISFDGRLNQTYSAEMLPRLALFSASFAEFSKWKGEETLPETDRLKLTEAIQKAHSLNKKIRFWATPDTPKTWQTLSELGVDWLGTDKPVELAEFLKK